MRERILRREQVLEVPVDEAFDFFLRAENLEAITPPLLRFRITTPTTIRIVVGTLIRYRLRLRGVPVSWLTRIEEWDPPRGFVDRQLKGPYALSHHTHCSKLLSSMPAEVA
jgi:ligand-binding SRPBCC domain-containing protein